MNSKATLAAFATLLALASGSVFAQAGNPVPVTVENFTRAETDFYMGNIAKEGGYGKFLHYREPASIDHQAIVRLNRDTLYSNGVFDLDAGSVTITLPDPGSRFFSLMAVDEDHYIHKVAYGKGSHTFTRKQIGTRYLVVAIRIFVDPANPADIAQVRALQDAITVQQAGSGALELPQWDPVSQKKVRDALSVLGSTLKEYTAAFGAKEDVDPVKHLIGTAMGWGGNPEKDATYLNFTPPQNDGKTAYKLVVKEVPVDAFWSISVYNAAGYFEPNKANAYSVNNVTAKKGPDGSVTIQFGGKDDGSANYLPITKGWNYAVRLYRPQKAILNGTWKFPEPVALK